MFCVQRFDASLHTVYLYIFQCKGQWRLHTSYKCTALNEIWWSWHAFNCSVLTTLCAYFFTIHQTIDYWTKYIAHLMCYKCYCLVCRPSLYLITDHSVTVLMCYKCYCVNVLQVLLC